MLNFSGSNRSLHWVMYNTIWNGYKAHCIIAKPGHIFNLLLAREVKNHIINNIANTIIKSAGAICYVNEVPANINKRMTN